MHALQLLSTTTHTTASTPRLGQCGRSRSSSSIRNLCLVCNCGSCARLYNRLHYTDVLTRPNGELFAGTERAGGGEQVGTFLGVFRRFASSPEPGASASQIACPAATAAPASQSSQHDEPLASCVEARYQWYKVEGRSFLSKPVSLRLLLHGRSSSSTWSRLCSPSRSYSRSFLLRLPARQHR